MKYETKSRCDAGKKPNSIKILNGAEDKRVVANIDSSDRNHTKTITPKAMRKPGEHATIMFRPTWFMPTSPAPARKGIFFQTVST